MAKSVQPSAIVHKVRRRDGSVKEFTAIPVMTVEEMRKVGPVALTDPAFVRERAAAARKRAESRGKAGN